MAKFRIQPHGRLAEWVAEEKDYFRAEGLEYTVQRGSGQQQTQTIQSEDGQIRRGAFEGMEAGRACEVSAACHWAVNMASSALHGLMYGHAYSVTPGGIMVRGDSPIKTPDDLRDVEIGVGFHSGSHFSTLQTLEPFVSPKEAKLRFIGGPGQRRDMLIEGKIEAVNVFGMDKDIVEQFGCRKVLDTTFMIGFLITGEADTDDVTKYFAALQRAQRDIDSEPEKYKHYYEQQLPEHYKGKVDVRTFSPGERIVFEPYTQDLWEKTHRWMEDLELFPEEQVGKSSYSDAVLV